MVLVKKYDEPQVNIKEILRYMGCKDYTDDIIALVSACLKEIEGKLSYRVCYDVFDIEISSDAVNLGFVKCSSKGLAINLDGCQKAIVFAATIGLEIDRLITKYSRLSPSKALCFQAIGAERIEWLCNQFCKNLSKEENITPRFSPGYGDLPLEIQKDIFLALNCEKNIGLTLNDSMLMSPTKSVRMLPTSFWQT